jgi:hypothetical protein
VDAGRPSTFGRWVDQYLRWLDGMDDVARDHRNDCICQSAIIAIILDDNSRSILAAPTVDVWKLDNDHVAARH